MRRPTLSPRALTVPLLAATVVASALVPALLVTAPTAAAQATTAVAPGAANTGVPDGAKLKRVDGTLILNKAGTTYSNLDVHGRVRVDAPNITLVNSIVRGDNRAVAGALVDVNNPKTSHNGFVLKDSTLVPQYPSAWFQGGIMGHHFTVVRADISRTVDAVHVVGGNVTVQRSWLHDTLFVPASRSPFHRDTHNDGVQVLSGSNVVISGNTISGNSNAALQVTQDAGVVSGVKFLDNWSNGGGCTVNVSPQPRASIGGITVSSNRFKHNTSVRNCAIVLNRGVTMSSSANTWQDTNTAVVMTRGA